MIPYARPYLGAQEMLAAVRPGAGRLEFEMAVARMVGARYSLAFSFAHAAFYALLKVLDLHQTEIILPAFTCDIMADVVVRTGNIPVFADVDLADLNMRPNAVKSALTPRTRAVVATHMFGYPADVEGMRELCDGGRIMLIEDSALSLTCSTRLRGDVALFSFGPGKPLYAVRGGVCVTNDASLYEKLLAYRDRHMGRLPVEEWGKRWARLMVTYFSENETGLTLAGKLGLVRDSRQRRPTSMTANAATAFADFQARIGLVLLSKADVLLAKRRAIATAYGRQLTGIPGLVPAPIIEGATFSHYTMRVQNRDALHFSERMYRHGVQTGRTFDYAVPYFGRYRQFARGEFPQARQAGEQVVNLPIHVTLAEREIGFVADGVYQSMRQANGG